ncbi:MAG: TonB-dependent receptor [Sphingobacteriales bacterium]|nr:MAG: TonB-dependent receptor [Sphingobacteriales bacterium]
MKKKLLLLTLCATMGMQAAFAQTRTVKGKVLEQSGEPAVGASVLVKGTTAGTMTDENGEYTLEVADENKVLVIKVAGSNEQEVTISADGAPVTTQLSSENNLNEVSIYGKNLDKRSYVGALTTVTAKDIARRPVTDIIKAIDGAAPGVIVTSGGGQPGSTPDILMRGVGSVAANNSPLIVLDGAPYSGTLVSINPNDVESMTFLKDATATALYGSRGANGVIVIVTKRGQNTGKPRINIEASTGILNRMLPEYERVGAKDYYELNWQGYKATVQVPPSSTDFVQNYLGGYNASNVPTAELMTEGGKVNPNASFPYADDWQDELQRTGIRQNYALSVSNGDKSGDYFFSVGYTKDQGIVKNSQYDRFTTRLNVNSNITSWLKTGISLSGTLDNQRFFLSSSNTAFSNPFFTTRMMGPIYPVYRYDANGNRMYEDDGTTPLYDFGFNDANNPSGVPQERPFAINTNVIGALFQDDRNTRALNGFGKSYLEAKFLKDFTFTTNFVLNYYSGLSDNFQNMTYGDASNVGGRLNRDQTTQYTYTFNQMLNWKPTFGPFADRETHHFDATLVHEAYLLRSEGINLTRTGFPSPDFTEGAAGAVGTGSTSQLDYQTLESYLAMASYDFKRKYYLVANVRRDGTSRFSPKARWGTFGSVGLGWIISDENFMKGTKGFLNQLKIRGSYGVTGQQDLGGGYYVWQPRYDINNNNSHAGFSFLTWGNEDLKWEGRLQANVGFDATMFNNRLNISMDYFNNGSRDMLFPRPLATSTGVSSVPINVGTMINKGIELAINADIVRTKDFTWNTRLNLTHLKNKITKVEGVDSLVSGFNQLAAGQPYNSFYVARYAGVNAETGEAEYYKADGSKTADYASLTPDDRVYAGAPYRAIDGSWTHTFSYKNFDLSFMVTFGIGGKFYDATYQNLMNTGVQARGQAWHVDMLKAWTAENPNTDVPRINPNDRYAVSVSDRWLMSSSFANLKNINFGYTLPSKIMSKAGFQTIRIYFAADNVLYLAGRKGVDLSQNLFGASSFTYYPYRTFMVGVNLGL